MSMLKLLPCILLYTIFSSALSAQKYYAVSLRSDSSKYVLISQSTMIHFETKTLRNQHEYGIVAADSTGIQFETGVHLSFNELKYLSFKPYSHKKKVILGSYFMIMGSVGIGSIWQNMYSFHYDGAVPFIVPYVITSIVWATIPPLIIGQLTSISKVNMDEVNLTSIRPFNPYHEKH